jgi:hypothetical protein
MPSEPKLVKEQAMKHNFTWPDRSLTIVYESVTDPNPSDMSDLVFHIFEQSCLTSLPVNSSMLVGWSSVVHLGVRLQLRESHRFHMYTSDVIGAKQNTCICYFFLLGCGLIRFTRALLFWHFCFFARVFGLGALSAGYLHMEWDGMGFTLSKDSTATTSTCHTAAHSDSQCTYRTTGVVYNPTCSLKLPGTRLAVGCV